MGKLKLLGDVVEGGLNAIKTAKRTTNEQKAAEKYAAGAQYADPLEPATMRMSEALGNAGAEGKTLNFTEADRSRVFGSNRGGVGFSGLQHYSLPHKEANTVWGFGKKSVAEKKVKQNDPEKSLITTFVGSPTQHKSNSVVIGDAIKEFQKSVKQGDVPREQIMLMNKRLNEITDAKTGAKVFEDGFDLTDPSALSVANTFSRRAAVGDVMLGLGVKGPMSRLDFKKKFPNTKFVDGSNIENILKRETDPDLVNAGTYDVGNRLFVMDGKIIERPDLNEAFPSQVTGYDLGMKYQLVPPNKAMRDFYKARENRLDKNQKPSPVSYYDLARAEPSQFVDEDYLTFLQKEGYKKGGAVEDFDAKVDKLIQNHHFDNHVDKRIKEHFAKGGDVKLARTSLRMAGGGMLGKGMAKLGKRLMADPAEATASIKGGTRKFGDEAGGNTVVKDVGGNWLRDSTGSSLKTLKRKTQGGMKPEDALVQMRERFSDVPEQQQNIRSLEADVALNKWVDSNLNNYVKKQMGTPEDPVRKLAEEDITHFPIAEDPAFWERRGESSRKKLGGSKMAQSDLAQQWENRTDAIIKRDTAQEHQSMMRQAPGMYEKGDEWINKLAPETPLYTSIMNPRDLGFDHIMDVLRADLQAGRIRPEQLNKVSMEQAVRRTYEYDQEMARKMAQSQFEVTKDMPIHKDYADKGYKWVELAPKKDRKPYTEENLPQGYTLEQDRDGFYQVRNKNVGEVPTTDSFSKTPEESIAKFNKWAKDKDFELQSALKYEGDTMGHCVGSYCDDVAGGKTRIYSLRDAKGEPHVTVEVEPNPSWFTKADKTPDPSGNYKSFHYLIDNERAELAKRSGGFGSVGESYEETANRLAQQYNLENSPSIVQIKGKGNAKPKEEYLPFVQDFVRGGNWSDVGDFRNTGLLQPYEVIGEESLKALKAKGIPIPKYLTKEEADELGKQAIRASDIPTIDEAAKLLPPAEGMANGGGILKYTTLRMGKGGLLGKGAKALAGAMKGEQLTSQAIGKAAESAGMTAPVTANKSLTNVQDYHTSLMDEVRRRSVEARKEMDAFNYKYDKGQRVFTEHGAKNNLPPLTVLERSRHGNEIIWEGEPWRSPKVIDPETGKAKRTPYGPGYKLRREGPEEGMWQEFTLPESAIKGDVEMARGGGVLKYSTLRNRNTTQSQPNRFADGGKSEMKATPRKKGYGVASDVLKGVHEFASKPFGYENPPVEFISELLGIPAASRVLDKLSYGEPITNAGKANVPLIPDDTFDAATAGLGGLGAASKLAKPLAKAAKKLPKDLPVGLSIKSVGDSPFGEKMMPTARIGLEAPGILIPSKMNNVREAVRNTKGNYGARRVERAADEIPNLERMYQEDALKEAFTGDNASAMMSINPSDFEKFARELERKTSVGPKAAELAKQGDIDKMTVTTDEYIKHLQRLKDGFSDVPYLNLNKDEVGLPTMPKVIGHEGRHRNRALADAGEKSSLVKINPRGDLREGMPRRTQEDYIEALREELERSNRLVLPETDPWFRRPEIQLPDIYARGGAILKHTTLRNRRANQRVR